MQVTRLHYTMSDEEFSHLVDEVHAAILLNENFEIVLGAGSLVNTFTPGPVGSGVQLYSRQLTMPEGARVVSRRHITTHPFNISKGSILVLTKDGERRYTAPFSGVTEPGTERILLAETETIWTTYHIIPEDITTPEEAVEHITAPKRTTLKIELAQKARALRDGETLNLTDEIIPI